MVFITITVKQSINTDSFVFTSYCCDWFHQLHFIDLRPATVPSQKPLFLGVQPEEPKNGLQKCWMLVKHNRRKGEQHRWYKSKTLCQTGQPQPSQTCKSIFSKKQATEKNLKNPTSCFVGEPLQRSEDWEPEGQSRCRKREHKADCPTSHLLPRTLLLPAHFPSSLFCLLTSFPTSIIQFCSATLSF